MLWVSPGKSSITALLQLHIDNLKHSKIEKIESGTKIITFSLNSEEVTQIDAK